MANKNDLRAERLQKLRNSLKAELLRRGLTSLTYSDANLLGVPVKALHLQEIKTDIDKINPKLYEKAPVADEQVKDESISNLESIVTNLVNSPKAGGSTSCSGGCVGLCVSCFGTCTGGCNGCSGCSGCTDSCSSCTGSCSGCTSCSGDCKNSCGGCVGCSGGCKYSCGNCTGSCASYCSRGCAYHCDNGCANYCTSGCSNTCYSVCAWMCANNCNNSNTR